MLHILGKIPKKVYIAVSGGSDSMAVLDFLSRGNREVVAAHFDHGTEHGEEARKFIEGYCLERSIPLVIGEKKRERNSDESPEEYWRNMRYDFFASITMQVGSAPIITAHTLDDQVENWIFTALNGEPRLIPYSREPNIIRPFITTTKTTLLSWCDRKNVPYVVDPGNSDSRYMRSLIRTEIVPQALRVNPGLFKVIKKKVLISMTSLVPY